MHQYLFGQGYWSYIKGAQENRLDPKNVDYLTWEQVASQLMYCLVMCVHDHIREAKTPTETWENLRNIFAANATARKLHLRQE